MLTEKRLLQLRPKEKEYAIADGQITGLAIRVRPSGAMSWVLRYNFDGAHQRLTIGRYLPGNGGISLRKARGLALELIEIRDQGQDPKFWFHSHQQQKVPAKSNTLAELAADFDRQVLCKRRHPQQPRKWLEEDILPVFGDRPCDQLRRRELLQLFQQTAARAHAHTGKQGAPTTANKQLALMKQLFDYGERLEYLTTNPLKGIRKEHVGGREKARERYLDLREIKVLFAEIDNWRTHQQNRLFIKFLLGSAQRIGTLSTAMWSEFDLDAGIWTIPASNNIRSTKSDQARQLPLSSYLLDLLRQQAVISADSPFLWPSIRNGHAPASYAVINQLLRNYKFAGLLPFTPHDLRRTAATCMAEHGSDPYIIERILGHRLAGIQAVYQRAKFLTQQHQALEDWGKQLAALEREAKSSS